MIVPRSHAQEHRAIWINRLHASINRAGQFDKIKVYRIDSLRQTIAGLKANDRYSIYQALCQEYEIFTFDSAYQYALKMEETAYLNVDARQLNYAKVKLKSILLSSGMFKEAFDPDYHVTVSTLDPDQQREYYALMARSYFDLADYNRDTHFAPGYNVMGNHYLDSCMSTTTPGSFWHSYYDGLGNIRRGNMKAATAIFLKLTAIPTLTLREQALANSTFSDIYIRKRITDSAVILLTKAAIADIQSSTKETTAILNLATLLFKERDLENASVFIQKAANDAVKFGARQRMVQVGNILPLIEAERMAVVQKEKTGIQLYAVLISFLTILLIATVVVIIRQVKQLKKHQREIKAKNTSLHQLLEEKEWLLKEVHHRVKNNLHTINSLLESQSAYLEKDALAAIRDSQRRVFAMSVIHQKLYHPGQPEIGVDISAYLHELILYLQESFETRDRITFEVDIQPLAVDITVAVAVGLIVNEAVTNSLKYAFAPHQTGKVMITLTEINGVTELRMADNGRGLPGGIDFRTNNSLGLKLMNGLSEDINGTFNIENHSGTAILITWPSHKNQNRNTV